MSSAKDTSLRNAPQVQPGGNLRAFHRRKLPVRVEVLTITGEVVAGKSLDVGLGGFRFSSADALARGSDGIANLELEDGSKTEAAVRIMWCEPAEHGYAHGAAFTSLDDLGRVAVMEAVHAPPADWPLDVLFDSHAEQVQFDSSKGAKPRSAPHHQYYLRIIRRIENIHSLSLADVDRLSFAVLQQNAKLADALLALGFTTYDQLDQYLEALYSMPYVDLAMLKPDAGVADLIPESIASSQKVVAVRRIDGKYLVAMADPLDLPTRDIVKMRSKDQFEIRFAFIDDVERAVRSVYQAASLHAADRLIDKASAGERHIELYKTVQEVTDLETLRRLSDATPIISLVDSLLRSAVEERASDIHLEPVDDTILVRFRLDGVLHEVRTLPLNLLSSVVSRIKIMAGMDITERHIPQDGRISMRYSGKDFELRVASLPTVFGEKIVVRLLEKNPMFKTMRSVGFSERNYQLFSPLIRRPYGMILFCGPTGSGKSTTLFTCIQEIHDGTTNIVTVEDPVEYRVRGINHVELNPKRNVTFPTVLRSILRGDPDVIYVGEIRDRETADLAVRAALTGHLLFSTLHTNTAIQAITRLVDIGVDPTLIGASLIGVVGQRLMRKICDWCKESYKPSSSELAVLRETMQVQVLPQDLYRGRGCSHCHKTGYYGRLPVHEVVIVDEDLRAMIGRGSSASALKEHLGSTDFLDLRSDAVDRLVKGKTTLQEVMRVTV